MFRRVEPWRCRAGALARWWASDETLSRSRPPANGVRRRRSAERPGARPVGKECCSRKPGTRSSSRDENAPCPETPRTLVVVTGRSSACATGRRGYQTRASAPAPDRMAPASRQGESPPEPPARRASCSGRVNSVRAGVIVRAGDREGLTRLCRYAARPPFSLKRLTILPYVRVAYLLRKPSLPARWLVRRALARAQRGPRARRTPYRSLAAAGTTGWVGVPPSLGISGRRPSGSAAPHKPA